MDKAGNWFKQAEEDLLWAKASLKERIWRGACFAAQQSAEKALKAFLISKEVRVAKIHDLVTLNQRCFNLEPRFSEIEEACNILSPYYLSSRYPDVAQFEEYSENQTKNAADQAIKIVDFVKSVLIVND
ncbi:HEPN domain-containing protein [Candidatus Daviesbacteria bacterium]|nr:HEPN domain-containing protein [Candidatus Daviesbacteria bacterium]